MTIPTWPEIPFFLRSSIQRRELPTFNQSQSANGKIYVDRFSTSAPTIYTGTLRLNAEQALIFKAFFRARLLRGVIPFKVPIYTEEEFVTVTARFLVDQLPRITRVSRNITDYQCGWYIEDVPDILDNEFILSGYTGASIIDLAVNQEYSYSVPAQ